MSEPLRQRLEGIWYGGRNVPWGLSLLERVYTSALGFRRWLYRTGIKRSQRLPLPVLVVGNITVGGTGKTPLTIWLAQELSRRGWRPGVILRGYGGSARAPLLVGPDTDPALCGDEALLIARATRVPVAVALRRAAAGDLLARRGDCDVLLADDGLQHWSLARDLEIAVVDGERRFGNGHLIPAGPLREPVERLQRVDFVVANGAPGPAEIEMRVVGSRAQNLLDPTDLRPLSSFAGQRAHAVAGIGNPSRFFVLLQSFGIGVVPHELPDHHAFRGDELQFDDELPVFVTEKDAVKCAQHAHERVWVVAVEAELPQSFAHAVHAALHGLRETAA